MLRNPLFSVYLHGSLQVNDPGRSIERRRPAERTTLVVRLRESVRGCCSLFSQEKGGFTGKADEQGESHGR